MTPESAYRFYTHIRTFVKVHNASKPSLNPLLVRNTHTPGNAVGLLNVLPRTMVGMVGIVDSDGGGIRV